MKTKNVLVTGSSGFIGRWLVETLLRQGHRVMGVDVEEARLPCQRSFRFTKGTIDGASLKKIKFVPDWIFHCAGGGSVGFAESHPLADFRMNVETCLEILAFAGNLGRSCPVVLVSSAAVYGNTVRKRSKKESRLLPLSNYGFHKRLAEQLFRHYAQRWSVPSVIVRLFSVYGEGLRKQVFWEAAQKMWRGERVFFGNGRETRDFVHVEDVCRFLVKVISKARRAAPIYNCGRGKPVSMRSALALLAKHLNRPPPRFNGQVRPGDPRHLVADPSMIRGLGWSPKIDFPEGILRYADWFQSLQRLGSSSHEKK